MSRTAIILFNLGGPDRPEAVKPFLVNLFSDPAIIAAPGPARWLLARLIAARRAGTARAIYAQLGGGSPILANTEAQAQALVAALGGLGEVRAFIAMRYWHPTSDETAAAVKDFAPDRILLLPLYPQYSSTTTGSSFADWDRAAAAAGLAAPTTRLCCYPEDPGFVAAMADLIRPALELAQSAGAPRLLFSAHGLPKRVIAAGDPYQWQVGRSASAIAAALGYAALDWDVCYQSRVGPLEWIGPETSAEIERAGASGRPVVLAPIAFVSEHSETLVELDIEYRHLAAKAGVPLYLRVATVSTHPAFIAGLADRVRGALARPAPLQGPEGAGICPAAMARCPHVP